MELILGSEMAFYSAMSVYEIAQKLSKGKLLLHRPLEACLRRMEDQFFVRELPVTGSISITAANLPKIHGDPFDRLLVATAQLNHLSLVTPDPYISRYPAVKVVW
jgi:PIN domain nuclease of toxin-antitoxin system